MSHNTPTILQPQQGGEMNTKEAIDLIERAMTFSGEKKALQVLVAELARVTAERDAILERGFGHHVGILVTGIKREIVRMVTEDGMVKWKAYSTRTEALRAAAGLDPESQEVPA